MPKVMRQACDRCHRQKLRCTSGDGDPCVRCLRMKVDCVYSASLPKGRPSTESSAPTMSSQPSSRPTVAVSSPLGQLFQDADDAWLPAQDPSTSWNWGSNYSADPGLSLPVNSPAEPPPRPKIPALGIDPIDTCVRQLAELSSRLYSIHKTTSSFAAAQEQHSGRLITDATFDAIAALFSANKEYAAPMCPTLHELFSASYAMLEILHHLNHIATSSAQLTPTTSSDSSSSLEDQVDMQGRERFARLNPTQGFVSTVDPPEILREFQLPAVSSTPSSSYGPSATVVSHLVCACYTLLLDIYDSLLLALQHDAELPQESTLPTNGSISFGLPSFSDVRLVLLVNFSRFFIDRLESAVQSCLSTSEYETPEQGTVGVPKNGSIASLVNTPVTRRKSLRVRQRLHALRKTLHLRG